ncbi:MAG: hypothetical protein ACLR8Y_07115 [Alistipes indistinctus]
MGDGLHRRDARAEQRRAFDAFLAGHPAIAAQIGPLQSDLPVLPPETVVYPDKTGLLRGRTISLARRQDRLQRFGAMASGAAAAAVLFGGLLFFHPGEGTKGPERIAAEAVEAYPEGAEALAARFDRQEATDTGHDATTAGTGNAGTRNSIAAAVPATDATHAPAALAAHYGNTGDRTAASGQGTPAGPARTGNSSSALSFIKRTDAAPASGTAAETGIFENSLPTESVLGSLSQPAELYLPEPAPDRRTGSHPAGPHPGAPVADCAPYRNNPDGNRPECLAGRRQHPLVAGFAALDAERPEPGIALQHHRGERRDHRVVHPHQQTEKQ